jgi:hypothetical protein
MKDGSDRRQSISDMSSLVAAHTPLRGYDAAPLMEVEDVDQSDQELTQESSAIPISNICDFQLYSLTGVPAQPSNDPMPWQTPSEPGGLTVEWHSDALVVNAGRIPLECIHLEFGR